MNTVFPGGNELRTLIQQSSNSNNQVDVNDNQKSIVGNPSQNKVQPTTEGGNWVPLIVGLSAVALVMIIAGSALFICYKLRRSENVRDNDVHLSTFNQGIENESVKFVERPTSNNSANRQQRRDVVQKHWDDQPAFDVKLEEIKDAWDKDDNDIIINLDN